MKIRRFSFDWIWFLMGLGSEYQLFGTSICFTELALFIFSPFILLKNFTKLRKNCLGPLLYLSGAMFLSGVLSCLVNHTPMLFVVRGMAVLAIIFLSIPMAFWLIKRNPIGIKWYFVGVAISYLTCAFIFKQSVELSGLGESTEEIMGGPVFWIGRLGSFAALPAQGWYMQLPSAITAGAPLALSFFAILTTVSGRSTAVTAFASAALIVVGGNRQRTIRNRISRRFGLIVLMAVVGAFGVKGIYRISAENDLLGSEARDKYENQTKGDKSMKALLLGGRMESFCGLIACVDKPLLGFGPWAQDTQGYREHFMREYGNDEDYQAYILHQERAASLGFARLIPAHAYITMFWLWYGLAGLVFWLYVAFVMLRYLKQDCWTMPQWYGWLAAGIPAYLWSIFFNPFAHRFTAILFVVGLLVVRAIRQNRFQLPIDMLIETRR